MKNKWENEKPSGNNQKVTRKRYTPINRLRENALSPAEAAKSAN